MKPEILFMKYSVPCAQGLVDLGRITQKEYENLQEKTRKEIALPKEELERIFVAAFRRIKDLAKKMKKDYWDIEVIKNYFSEGMHNMYIDDGEGAYGKVDESFKERCKVKIAMIKSIRKISGKTFLNVEYDDGKRTVFSDYIKNPKVGDKGTIHHFYACEKL